MVDLKPCPFCGGNAEELYLEDEANFGGSVICCQKCGASSPVHFDRKENLYDSWNRRTEAKQDEPVAWGEFYGGKIVAVSLHKTHYYTVPLYTHPSPAPEDQQDAVVVSVADINTWRAEWLDANDPQDGTDCVTPFDKYLYTRPRKVK